MHDVVEVARCLVQHRHVTSRRLAEGGGCRIPAHHRVLCDLELEYLPVRGGPLQGDLHDLVVVVQVMVLGHDFDQLPVGVHRVGGLEVPVGHDVVEVHVAIDGHRAHLRVDVHGY